MKPILSLHLNRLTFPPQEQSVLSNIDLLIEKGECIAVTGAPASGKTMLLHTLTGAAEKFYDGDLDGSVIVSGRDIKNISLPEISEMIGFMFQEPQNQIVSSNIHNEVAFGIGNLGIHRDEIERRVEKYLRFVNLYDLKDRKSTSLSGGQAQRLVLAGVLAMETPILIMDQPGAELDLAGKKELYGYIRELNRNKGVTVVIVPDNGITLSDYFSRVIEMNNGTIVSEHAPEYSEKEESSVIIPAFSPIEQTVLSAEHICYTYKGGFVGCEDISFSLYGGDFMTVMGKNGSGKTTLMKLTEGLLQPQKGSITLFGEKLFRKNAYALRRKIGFLFQNPDDQIFADTVQKEVAFSLSQIELSKEEKDFRTDEVLKKVGLYELREEHPQKLSRSQRQKLAFASALVHHPKLIIADEPTSGLNEDDSRALLMLLSDFRAEGGTVLIVSHDPVLAKIFSNHILILDDHSVVGDYRREDFSMIPDDLLYSGGVEQ